MLLSNLQHHHPAWKKLCNNSPLSPLLSSVGIDFRQLIWYGIWYELIWMLGGCSSPGSAVLFHSVPVDIRSEAGLVAEHHVRGRRFADALRQVAQRSGRPARRLALRKEHPRPRRHPRVGQLHVRGVQQTRTGRKHHLRQSRRSVSFPFYRWLFIYFISFIIFNCTVSSKKIPTPIRLVYFLVDKSTF